MRTDWTDEGRPDPEDLLEQISPPEVRQPGRGRHKIFLGFAAGVGKTFEMLNEANRRKQRGEDVVVGYFESHGRKGTEEQLGDLDVVPRRKITYRGAAFEEMDTDAVVARHPQVALVDELAHTNVPGSDREKRWQDVDVILSAGIDVISTLNVQHLESLNDAVHDITGVWVRETLPDRILHEADEVKMVDIPPEALLNRLQRGDIYPVAKVDQAMRNWFREGNLGALREIALREIAHEVDEQVTTYRRKRRIADTWPTHDRIMVCISPTQPSLRLIRRGWRIAQRLDAAIVAVYVQSKQPTEKEQKILQDDFALSDRLTIPVVTLHGNVAAELIRYARENSITQMVIGHSSRTRWQEMWRGSIVNALTRELRSIDILIVAPPKEAD